MWLTLRTVPTFQIYFGGEKVERIQGAHLDELEESLTGMLDKNST